MATSVGQIGLDLVVNKNGFEKQMQGITGLAKKAGAALAGAFAVKKLIDFGKECIELGSNLEEVQNVVDVTFPTMAAQVDTFAKSAAMSFGLSETMAKKFTGTFGAMAKAFGFTEKQAYDMGSTLTGLSGDVASFYNISQDEAYTKLKSVFTGETETLKDLGVVMTQNALDAYAMANGYGKVTKDMSEAEKVALRYAFVQKQLSAASGDFARTSDSWANQTRILKLQLDSIKATIGQGFINLFKPIIKSVNTLLGKIMTLANAFKSFTELITGNKAKSGSGMSSLAKAAGDAGGSFTGASGAADGLAESTEGIGSAAKKAAKEIKKSMLGIDEINKLSPKDESADDGGGSGGAGGGGIDFGGLAEGETVIDKLDSKVAKLAERFREFLENLQKAAQPTVEALKRIWNEGLSELGSFAWGGLKDFYEHFLVPIGKWTLGEGLPRFLDITNEFLKKIHWDEISEALRNFWDALAPFAINVGRGLLDFYEDLMDVGADFINAVVPGGLNALAKALGKIDPETARDIGYALGVVATGVAAVKLAIKGFKMAEGFILFIDTIKHFKLPAGLILFFDKIKDFVAKIGGIKVGGVFTKLAGGLTALGIAIGGFVVQNPEFTFSALAWLEQTFPNFYQEVESWLSVFDDPKDGILGLIQGIFWDIAEAVPVLLQGVWDGIVEAFKSTFHWEDTIKWFGDAGGYFTKAFNGEDVGKNIILGLINGIAGVISLVLEPFKNIIANVLALFGIHSPSTVFYDIGDNMIRGLYNALSETWTSISDFFITAWEGIKQTISEKWEAIKTTVSEAINTVKTNITNVFNEIKTVISEKIESAKVAVTEKFESIKTAISVKVESAKKAVVDKFESIKTSISTTLTTAKTNALNIFDNIKTGIGSKIDAAKELVKTGIEKIKNFFKFEWSLPKLKMPHFSISGNFSLNPPSIPKFGIDWYAKGGVINSPTLAMMGENGKKEAVVPLERNLGWRDAITDKIMEQLPRTGSGGGQSFTLDELMGRLQPVIMEAAKLFAGLVPKPQYQADTGDTVIPIYLGNELIDEIIITAQDRRNLRTGGR